MTGLSRYSRPAILQSLLDMFESPSYLEIGVHYGSTFTAIKAAHKVAVDPFFQFDFKAERTENGSVELHETTSDDYFGGIAHTNDRFDVVFLDGLHVAEQTIRDLLNAIVFLKPLGIIVIDDVKPDSYYASLSDQASVGMVRKFLARSDARILDDQAWMGDVFKLPFFVRSYLQQFSYATVSENHGQTILWREARPAAGIVKNSLEEIGRLEFKDFVAQESALNTMPLDEILERIAQARKTKRMENGAVKTS